MEHQKADFRPAAGFGAPGDDATRFLRELRQLRDGAGLGHAELAARAHYPYDSIRAAEAGPSLPDLPVLSAFVRACGGTAEEWEERWRSLTKSPSLPVPATRQSGQSDAATAGARIGSAALAGDSLDPSVIMAALSRVAEDMASPVADDDLTALPGPVPPVQATPVQATPTLAQAAAGAALPPDGPGAGDKQAGWDPIRVSAAWPALKHTPTIADQAAAPRIRGGAGVPWDTAGWTASPAGTAPAGGTGRAAGGRPASAAGGTPARHSAARSPRMAIVAVAVLALLLIVIALAVFA